MSYYLHVIKWNYFCVSVLRSNKIIEFNCSFGFYSIKNKLIFIRIQIRYLLRIEVASANIFYHVIEYVTVIQTVIWYFRDITTYENICCWNMNGIFRRSYVENGTKMSRLTKQSRSSWIFHREIFCLCVMDMYIRSQKDFSSSRGAPTQTTQRGVA